MPDERLGASFSIDTTNLKTGLAQANRLIRESQSQFKAAAAGMQDWTKSEDGLNAKIKSLNSVTAIQKTKVNALKSEYQRLIDNGLDPASAEAVNLRTKINDETASLNKNEAELERQKKALEDLRNASGEAADEVEEVGKAAKETEGGFTVMKGAMANLVSQGITAVIDGCKKAASAMVSLVKSSLNAAGELEQNMGGSEAVFKKYADGMQKTAKDAFKNMGLSQSDYLATANKMGALFQGSGFSIKDSADMSAKAMQRAADVASIMGVDLSSAMEAVSGAAKGNFTMMDNLGVAMNDTTLKAYAQEKGLGELETTQDKVGVAMQMFLDKTAYAAGNYAKENETLSGSLTTAKAAFDNFLAGSGSVDDLVGAFTNAGKVIVDNLVEIVPRLLTGITELIQKLIPEIPPLIEQLLPALMTGLTSLIQGIVGILPTIVSTIVGILPELLTSILGMLPEILSACITIIVEVMNALTKMLPEIVSAIIEVVPQLIDALINAIPQLLDAAIEFLLAIIDAIPVLIQKLYPQMPKIVDTIIKGLLKALPQLVQGAIKLFMAILKAIPEIQSALIQNLPLIIRSIVGGLIKGIPEIVKAGGDLLAGLFKGLLDPKQIAKSVKTLFNGIVGGLKNLFGIHSPSKVMENLIGKNLALGIGVGFKDNIKGVNDMINGSFNIPDVNNSNGVNGRGSRGVVIYQTNNYSQAHSRYELYKSKQQTAAAVRLAIGTV